MRAYKEAIDGVCRGKVVCEIGVGLGPLSLLALLAGADRVFGIEVSRPALNLATDIIGDHGFDSSRFVPIHGLSTEVTLPERVDVILSETLDSIGIGENTHTYMRDARERFLKPQGIFLPQTLTCYLALARPTSFTNRATVWEKTLSKEFGMDYGQAAVLDRSFKHTIPISADEIVGDWLAWQRIDFREPQSFQKTRALKFPVRIDTTVLGLAATFDACLAGDVHIRTFPEDADTHWMQGFKPFPDHAVVAKAGDVIYVELDLACNNSPSLSTELRVVHGEAAKIEAFAAKRSIELGLRL